MILRIVKHPVEEEEFMYNVGAYMYVPVRTTYNQTI